MSATIKGLKPELLWKYFARICRIPRGSKNEEAIIRYVLDTARKLGLEGRTDRIGNVVVRKPASEGRSSVSPIALQGHLDMVCEKNRDSSHDFSKDPIRLVRKGDELSAKDTTLGADNGIAVAAMLAVMEDRSLEHGPLEMLFTVDEETGMTGALNLEECSLDSRTLLNLDSEDEGTLYIGCAGGRDTTGTWRTVFEDPPQRSVPVQIRITNLKGGHSGLEIHKDRGNAIKIANRILMALEPLGARLSRIGGGNKHNAIPRECVMHLYLPADRIEQAENLTGDLHGAVSSELSVADPDINIAFISDFSGAENGKVVKRALQRKLSRVLAALPHGVIRMSADIAGLVETSSNVAVISTGEDSLFITTSQRSSVASELDEITDAVSAVFSLGGASVKYTDGYPGWKPDAKSPILRTARSAYRALFAKRVKVTAIHAGLECGVIGERIPGMDMISFGPTIEGAHSPAEKVYVESVGKFWDFLLEILKRAR